MTSRSLHLKKGKERLGSVDGEKTGILLIHEQLSTCGLNLPGCGDAGEFKVPGDASGSASVKDAAERPSMKLVCGCVYCPEHKKESYWYGDNAYTRRVI